MVRLALQKRCFSAGIPVFRIVLTDKREYRIVLPPAVQVSCRTEKTRCKKKSRAHTVDFACLKKVFKIINLCSLCWIVPFPVLPPPSIKIFFEKNWFSVNRHFWKEIPWAVPTSVPIVQCGVPDVRQARGGYAGLHISTLFPPASLLQHLTKILSNLITYVDSKPDCWDTWRYMIVSARLSKVCPASTNSTLQDEQKADDLLNVLEVCYLQFGRSDVNSASARLSPHVSPAWPELSLSDNKYLWQFCVAAAALSLRRKSQLSSFCIVDLVINYL